MVSAREAARPPTHTGHLSVEQYARQLFDHWGPGFKDRNYGILLLVSVGDRKARIELGAGWGGEAADRRCRQGRRAPHGR